MRGRILGRLTPAAAVCALALASASCRTPALPSFATSTPGWTLLTGQAVWTPTATAEALAGDFVVAAHPDGRLLIDFSKGSLSVAIVRCTPQAWRLEVPAQNRAFGGHGWPPPRSSWLVLARDQAGQPPPKGWEFAADQPGVLRIRSLLTGESLELYPAVP